MSAEEERERYRTSIAVQFWMSQKLSVSESTHRTNICNTRWLIMETVVDACRLFFGSYIPFRCCSCVRFFRCMFLWSVACESLIDDELICAMCITVPIPMSCERERATTTKRKTMAWMSWNTFTTQYAHYNQAYDIHNHNQRRTLHRKRTKRQQQPVPVPVHWS